MQSYLFIPDNQIFLRLKNVPLCFITVKMSNTLAEAEQLFGSIGFVRSARASRIRVRILSDSLKVSFPIHISENEAIKFILDEQKAILAKQQKLSMSQKNNPTIIDENTRMRTLTFDVVLSKVDRKDIFFSLKNGLLTIEFPAGEDCLLKQNQEYCWNGINYFLRKEAKRLLPERTKQLAGKFGFYYSTVKIQASKSRWGSCSRERSINLSFFLMLLPAHLVDYVILHELCHTKEMNHSDKFWRWMDKVTDGKSRDLRKELKNYHMPD
jgi:predicted metal-dependent hydrolase